VLIDTVSATPGMNQDRFFATPVGRGVFVVVCDGAGGVNHGDLTAATVVRELVQHAEVIGLDDLAALVAGMDKGLVLGAHGGETTCVAAWITPLEVYGVSVGDSEAWWVGDSAIELTAQQSRARLGSGSARVTSFRRLRAGGSVIVGTDGFFSYAPRERWLDLVRTSPTTTGVARRLLDLARLPTGTLQDDATVVVVTR